MVFQATKWSWKRLAARLLLVPILAGSAGAAQAQMKSAGATGSTPPNKTAAGPVMTAAPGGDPKAMLKEGRKALAEHRYNDAQDLARRAEASNASGKWGLFDDTPAALLKDVQVSVQKAQKAEAEQLTKQAKALFTKHAASEAERAANLDQAMQMARRADSLHGPYSAWDLSDRPDKLAKDIETARGKMKVVPAAMAAAPAPNTGVRPAVGATTPGAPSGVVPAGGVPTGAVKPAGGVKPPVTAGPTSNNTKTAAGMDPRKQAAVKLIVDAKQLADKGDFAGAHAKLVEAQKLNATFTANEVDPGFALRELSARGVAAIDGLLKEAQSKIAKQDYSKAEAALNSAQEIAGVLNLFPRKIEEARTALRMRTDGKFGGAPASGLTAAGGEEKLVPIGIVPVAPPGAATVGGPDKQLTNVPPISMPVVGKDNRTVIGATSSPTGGITGRQMLDQATNEFSRGNFAMAEQLARKAHNLGGVQAEATGLLNQIDAEVFAAKQRNAMKSMEAAEAACRNHDHGHALSVLALIDPMLLPSNMKAKRDELMAQCKVEVDKVGGKLDVLTASGTQPPMTGSLQPMIPSATNPPGTASIGDPKASANPDSLATQADAMRKVTFQKLRSDGLKVLSDTQAAFGRGDTDVAIQMLIDYSNKVRAAGLDNASVALLLRPIDSRMEMFKVMKGQTDAITRVNRENSEAKALVANRGAADEQRKAEVARLVRQCNDLMKKSDYATAERVAMQAKTLDPDNAAVTGMCEMVKMTRRVKEADKLKDEKERMVLAGLNGAEHEGPYVDTLDPVAVNIQRQLISNRRGRGDDAYLRTRTPKEFEIEMNLDKPITVDFHQTPLSEIIESLREKTHLPFSWDTASLTAEQVSTAMPITEKLGGVSTRNALHLILDKAGLSFVIEYDTIRITTLKKAKGRLVTKVFSVADLVTPIPNFALPDYANFEKMMSKGSGGAKGFYPGGGALLPQNNGIGGGVPAGAPAGATLSTGSPVGVSGGANFSGAGTLQNNPLGSSSPLASDRGTKHEQLMKLVTGMVRPFSWDSQGGPGRIEYFDIGSALVVNQTADVIREVADLLEALRRLQDLAVAVEVRIISLSETWFERMGVDFSMNIKTNTTKFEPALTSGQFRPEPFVNDINNKGVTLGLQPAGVFTPDLDVPIRATSFNYAIPGFGGYPNNPGANGGVSLGLAFLNDIQVYLFMEAAQGDRRVNVMQAPKLTMFNGQTATITVNELQFFVTDVQVFSVNGQIVFIPQVTPLPGPGNPLLGGALTLAIQSVVSADRRFVRINLPITLAAQSGAVVPLFPITTFITPVFEGGSQGVPIPFTQFIQQPGFITMNINTTVVCPDGGTVLLGGLKKLSEGRNEFGPPFLSKIPYLNRLFKNVGIGRETQHVMIMVTPRIIINSEEEINQTEGGPLGSGAPGAGVGIGASVGR